MSSRAALLKKMSSAHFQTLRIVDSVSSRIFVEEKKLLFEVSSGPFFDRNLAVGWTDFSEGEKLGPNREQNGPVQHIYVSSCYARLLSKVSERLQEWDKAVAFQWFSFFKNVSTEADGGIFSHFYGLQWLYALHLFAVFSYLCALNPTPTSWKIRNGGSGRARSALVVSPPGRFTGKKRWR